jgi:malonyl CoA-acyl carrier protein transacylase
VAKANLGLAVIGMGHHTARFSTVDALERALYDGTAAPDVAVSAGETAMIKASLKSLERHEGRLDHAGVVEEALHDGGLPGAARAKTALVLLARPDAFGADARLLAERCGLGGPSIVLPDGPAGLAQAMKIARDWLAGADIPAVVVVAADLGDAPDPADPGGAGERNDLRGAVALLVAGAATGRHRAYATVDAIGVDGAAAGAARDALRAAGTTPERVEHVVLAAPSDVDAMGLARVWPQAVGGPRHAALALVREAGAVGLLGAVMRAALCLHHCYLPAGPDGGGPGPAGSGLYLPWRSHPWVRASSRLPRQACVVAASGESAACLVLSGATVRGEVAGTDWGRVDERVLLPVCGRDLGDLVRALARAADAVRDGHGIAALAREAAAELPDAPLRAVLCAPPASLAIEVERALAGVEGAYAAGRDWASPAGSYLAARPIGPAGRVALVFPGIFSAYPGLGRDLPRCFPGILTWAESLIERPGPALRESLLYRAEDGDSPADDLAAWESDLPALATVGTLFGVFYAELARRLLGLPDPSEGGSDGGETGYGAFGYSLGESTMTVATRSWAGEAGDVARLAEIPLFRDGQAGACRVVRARWGLPETMPDKAVWGSRLLFADAEVVRARAGAFERVFVTHVNTPGEVVVAGDPARCEALARAVGCPSIPSAFSHILHTPLTDVRALRELLRRLVRPAAGVELLSARRYGPLGALAATELAEDLAEVMRRPVDFPRLVRAAYVRGYRYFLEVGPGATCTRWVHDSLAGRPHLAESLDRRGMSTATSVVRLVARLASHGAPVELAPFLPGRDTAAVLNEPVLSVRSASHA